MINNDLLLDNPNIRIVCHYSCGAASAVACKIAIELNKKSTSPYPLEIIRCYVAEEHEDNNRFMKDCEKWFGQKITVLNNERYNSSIYEVFKKDRYLVGPTGARCTKKLKKALRENYQRYGDIHVFGYHIGEEDRINRFIDSNNEIELWNVLIDNNMTKQDCLALLAKKGIELPTMYKLGYRNNNCIGCVKGGMGYWNKIRIDFPQVFNRMSTVEKDLGRTVLRTMYIDKNGNRESKPLPLSELNPIKGNYSTEADIECGVACMMTELKIDD